jgi:hypothetical protein
MQNLERYYGFKAEVMTLLEPERVEQIRAHAIPILEYKGYNPAEYHIYCHQLRISENPSHWAAGLPLHSRVEILRLTFRVNPKQRKSGGILFHNWRFGVSVEQQLGFFSADVASEGSSWEIHYNIRKQFVQGQTTFKNAIVTFVRNDVRPDHRKIKIELIANPTQEHERRLKKAQAYSETRLDLRLKKGWFATLLPPPERSEAPATGPVYILTQLQQIEQKLQKARSTSRQTSLLPPSTSIAGAQMERRRVARIKKLESEYEQALERLVGRPLSETDAHSLLASIDQLLSRYEQSLRNLGNPQVLQLLDNRHLLLNQDRPVGTRLKLAIPVIPFLLHYEVDFSTDSAVADAFQRLRRVFGRRRK